MSNRPTSNRPTSKGKSPAPPLPGRPVAAQLRFTDYYAHSLGILHDNGYRWQVGPARFPVLAGGPSRLEHVLSISHARAGLLGQLTLPLDGYVRDEAGRTLSGAGLLAWVEHRTTGETHVGNPRQSEIATVLNAARHRKARRELPWVRSSVVAGLVGLVGLVAATATMHPLPAQASAWGWPAMMASLVWAEAVLLWRWRYLHTWLARRATA